MDSVAARLLAHRRVVLAGWVLLCLVGVISAGDRSSAEGFARRVSAQVKALSLPKTAMVVTVDIPCDDAGHPHDKQDPAKRLALAARTKDGRGR